MLDGMAEEPDRLGIAQARIAEEAARRAGDLRARLKRLDRHRVLGPSRPALH